MADRFGSASIELLLRGGKHVSMTAAAVGRVAQPFVVFGRIIY